MSRALRLCLRVILLLPALFSAAAVAQYRFLVMGDPQFRIARPGDKDLVGGYHWTSSTWAAMPRLCERLGARRFFVCGDLFEYQHGDGSAIPALWDHWDRYLGRFQTTTVGWITGGHEFWGGGPMDREARQTFLARYPDRIRYSIVDGDNLFILFDNIHDPKFLDPNGLQWLEQLLSGSQQKRRFFFGHVPPRDTASWWPDGTDAKADEFRSKMAAILEKHQVTAAFFGHEHISSYIADPGGFPMFCVGVQTPLLVEINDERVSYRWLNNPLADDPLAKTTEAVFDRPVQRWQIAFVPPGRKLALIPTDPSQPLELDDGSRAAFLELASERVSMANVPGVQQGGQLVAIADIPRDGLWGQHIRIRSGVPGTLYFNGRRTGQFTAHAERGSAWLVNRERGRRNVATLVLDITQTDAIFTLIPHTCP